MNILLDLTRERFELVDFCEALLFFDNFLKLPQHLEFNIWGATLPPDLRGQIGLPKCFSKRRSYSRTKRSK